MLTIKMLEDSLRELRSYDPKPSFYIVAPGLYDNISVMSGRLYSGQKKHAAPYEPPPEIVMDRTKKIRRDLRPKLKHEYRRSGEMLHIYTSKPGDQFMHNENWSLWKVAKRETYLVYLESEDGSWFRLPWDDFDVNFTALGER